MLSELVLIVREQEGTSSRRQDKMLLTGTRLYPRIRKSEDPVKQKTNDKMLTTEKALVNKAASLPPAKSMELIPACQAWAL